MDIDVNYNVYSNNCSLLYFDQNLAEIILSINLKVIFQDGVSGIMECSISDESIHSDVLSEINFMNSTKESENKDAECIFSNGKFSEDQLGEI